jgi:CRP/FNR family transcriptional regulator, cyclic AMP receptor protein
MFKRTYPKAKVVFKEGEAGSEAFLVEKGKILILKKGVDAPIIVASLGPGALFGEMAILDGGLRMATAVAGEDTVCIVVNSQQLTQRLMSLDPDLVRLITSLMEYCRSTVPFDSRTKAGLPLDETPADRHARMMLPPPHVVESYGLKDSMMKALMNMLCDYTRRRLPPAPGA